MVLVDWRIRELIKTDKLSINPFTEDSIGPASIDLRLNDDMIRFDKYKAISIFHQWTDDTIFSQTDNAHFIGPKQFALCSTIEYIRLPSDVVGQLEGRSSIGRQGIFIHNAGFIDPGFEGQITLELFNATDTGIVIPVGTKICQLVLFECDQPDTPYNKRKSSKYIGQTGVTASRLTRENHVI